MKTLLFLAEDVTLSGGVLTLAGLVIALVGAVISGAVVWGSQRATIEQLSRTVAALTEALKSVERTVTMLQKDVAILLDRDKRRVTGSYAKLPPDSVDLVKD